MIRDLDGVTTAIAGTSNSAVRMDADPSRDRQTTGCDPLFGGRLALFGTHDRSFYRIRTTTQGRRHLEPAWRCESMPTPEPRRSVARRVPRDARLPVREIVALRVTLAKGLDRVALPRWRGRVV